MFVRILCSRIFVLSFYPKGGKIQSLMRIRRNNFRETFDFRLKTYFQDMYFTPFNWRWWRPRGTLVSHWWYQRITSQPRSKFLFPKPLVVL